MQTAARRWKPWSYAFVLTFVLMVPWGPVGGPADTAPHVRQQVQLDLRVVSRD